VFAAISEGTVLESGNVKPEMLINIDAFAIIALMLPMGWITGKFHPMIALIAGMVLSVVAFTTAGATNVGLVVALAIFAFAIGEMWCSPKFSEYIGLTAPPEKKATYMGYSNIPFAVGWGVGNLISGFLYESLGSKINFARQYLVNQLGMNPADAEAIPTENVMDTMASLMNGGQGVHVDEATRVLWEMHDPWMVWVILGALGAVSTLFMVGYYFKTKHTGISSTNPNNG
jgi:MFS family permease